MIPTWKSISGIGILYLSFSCLAVSVAQEITEEKYLETDKMIWAEYYAKIDLLSAAKKKYPGKRDSLRAVAHQEFDLVNKKNREAAIKFASVPSGLQRLFMVRLQIPKDTLLAVMKSLTPEVQNSPYGKSIMLHIHSEQIEVNSHYYDIKTVDTDGKEFLLSSLKGKNVLFVYGGLDCMGEGGRTFLGNLYRETSRYSFQIVVYWPCSDLGELKALKTKFPSDYYFVSDFLQDHSPVKIQYGAQAKPTCFLINKEGIVVIKTVGLPEEGLDTLKEENKL